MIDFFLYKHCTSVLKTKNFVFQNNKLVVIYKSTLSVLNCLTFWADCLFLTKFFTSGNPRVFAAEQSLKALAYSVSL